MLHRRKKNEGRWLRLVVAAGLLTGCANAVKLLVIGDPCIKDDICQSGRCDEFRCAPKDPAEVGEPCENNYYCRSKTCGITIDDMKLCTRGPRPPRAGCTADDQCAVGSCVEGACVEGTDGGISDGGALDMELSDAGQRADAGVQPDVGGVVLPATWVQIPPLSEGPPPFKFWMGAGAGDTCPRSNEDHHEVTLTHRFELMATEVTQAQYEALMGYNPSYFGPNEPAACGVNCPVELVTWHQAAYYSNRLSASAGYAACYDCALLPGDVICKAATGYAGQRTYECPGYRLPTEAEWEYAYRAGSTTEIYPSTSQNGALTVCIGTDQNADKIGWHGGGMTREVSQKEANAWELHDMAGNVWEWCHDWYQASLGTAAVSDPWGSASGSSRVLRGGGYQYDADNLRAARRNYFHPSDRSDLCGFRLARTLFP